MNDEIDETKDWQGKDVDCTTCAHEDMLATGKCRLSHACVNDRYARRIDRFFNWNPKLADQYVRHEHFEVRAIAAKHASVFVLLPLLHDPEETVRWNAARRLPKKHILELRHDQHREVRIRIVSLLEDADLVPMLQDPDYYVRLVIARRLAPNLLEWMMHDEEAEVRRTVAQRLPDEWLMRMASDPEARVRLEVARRLEGERLERMRHDPDWRVRYEVASRIDPGQIGELVGDRDELVREAAISRRPRPGSSASRVRPGEERGQYPPMR